MSAATERLAQAIADVIAEAVGAAAPATARDPLPPADFTVAQLAARFGRTPSCVRAWLDAGRFEGAYKLNNKDWRVPVAGVLAFEAAARTQPAPTQQAVPSLSAWRRATSPTRRRRGR